MPVVTRSRLNNGMPRMANVSSACLTTACDLVVGAEEATLAACSAHELGVELDGGRAGESSELCTRNGMITGSANVGPHLVMQVKQMVLRVSIKPFTY